MVGASSVGFHCRCLRTSGSAWTSRVGDLVFGLPAMAGTGGQHREGSVSFEYATPSDSVVSTRANSLLCRNWFRRSRLWRRQARGNTIPPTAFS
jgi:hypothetical protein